MPGGVLHGQGGNVVAYNSQHRFMAGGTRLHTSAANPPSAPLPPLPAIAAASNSGERWPCLSPNFARLGTTAHAMSSIVAVDTPYRGVVIFGGEVRRLRAPRQYASSPQQRRTPHQRETTVAAAARSNSSSDSRLAM